MYDETENLFHAYKAGSSDSGFMQLSWLCRGIDCLHGICFSRLDASAYHSGTSDCSAESIVLCGVQRIPFDLSTCLFGLAGLLCCVFLDYNLDFTGDSLQWMQLQLTGIIVASLGLTVLFFLWTHLLCAQIKARILLRNTLCGRFCIRIWKLLRHNVQGIGKSIKQTQQLDASAAKLSGWARIRQGSWKHNPLFRTLSHGARRGVQQLLELFHSINVIWKLCGVTAFVMLFWNSFRLHIITVKQHLSSWFYWILLSYSQSVSLVCSWIV